MSTWRQYLSPCGHFCKFVKVQVRVQVLQNCTRVLPQYKYKYQVQHLWFYQILPLTLTLSAPHSHTVGCWCCDTWSISLTSPGLWCLPHAPLLRPGLNTAFVAGYELICVAKLVIDPVHQCIWSQWHTNVRAPYPSVTPPPTTTAASSSDSVHLMSAPHPSTSISPADRWLNDCLHLIGVNPTAADSHSTPSPSLSLSAHVPPPSPSARVSTPSLVLLA